MSEARPRLQAACTLLSYDRVDSTNDEAKRLARDGAREWTVVWAHEQTAGRGRRGRQWSSMPGNLYVSILLRPRCTPAQAAQLGFAVAIAAGEAVATLAPPDAVLRYKWPNDVLLNGGKIAGILLESEMTEAGTLAWLVAGIGINVAGHPPETAYPAASLRGVGASEVGVGRMLETFVERFFTWTGRWLAEGFAPVRSAWLAGATGLGDAITARLDRQEITGRFAGIDADGALLLETPAGERRITAGDVFPVRGREGSS